MIADKLAGIADPGAKAAAAMDIFGKSGANLVPLLSGGSKGISDLMAEADALGLVMSGKDAAAAAEFGDALDKLGGVVLSIRNAIGAALAPVLTDIIGKLVSGAASVKAFVDNHRELVVLITKGVVAFTSIGAAIMAIGIPIATVGGAVAGLVALSPRVALLSRGLHRRSGLSWQQLLLLLGSL